MKIVIVSASTRTGRQTHKVALGIQKKLESLDGVQPIVLDLLDAQLPKFQEVMHKLSPIPAEVQQVFDVLDAADAFLLVTPEYNGSYSSELKLLVDIYPKAVFARKAMGIVTVTTGMLGGMRAAMQMQQLIPAVFGITCPQMLLVGAVQNKFDDVGELIDPGFTKNVDVFLAEFLWLSKALYNAKHGS